MMLKIAFQMEAMEETDPSQNHTLRLMHEACARGYEVYHYQPQQLSLYNGVVSAPMRRVEVNLEQTPHYRYDEALSINLAELDVVLFRQDPPVDMEYITNTYLLEMVAEHTFIINNPYWIRNATDKLYPFEFKEFMPDTLVSADPVAMQAFKKKHKDIVIKPLYGFHGHGIVRVETNQDITPYLEEHPHETLLLQPFIPEIVQGNKRIVFLDGEIAGALLTKPAEGEFKVYRNSVDMEYELSPRDKEICAAVGKSLKERGLFFVGIDIIGDYLTEINLGSVGSIWRLDAVYNTNFSAQFWDAVENKLRIS